MLVQVVALLSLGMLCSSASLQATGRINAGRHSRQCSRTLLGLTIQEVLHDMRKLNLSPVSSTAPVNAMMERCMHSYLKTFASSLAALDMPRKTIVKMTKIATCKDILPKDLDKECKTVQVTGDVLETLEIFLRLLYQKIQNA